MKVNIKEPKYLLYKNKGFLKLITRSELVEKLTKVGLNIYQDNQAPGWKCKIYIDEKHYAIIQPLISIKNYACKECGYETKHETNHYLQNYSLNSFGRCKNLKCVCSRPVENKTHEITVWICKDKPSLAEIIVRYLHFSPSNLEYNNSDLLVLDNDKSVLRRYLDEHGISYTRYISNIEGQDWYGKIITEIPFAYTEFNN